MSSFCIVRSDVENLKCGDLIQIYDQSAGWIDRIFVKWDTGYPVCKYPNMTWEPTLYLRPWRHKRS